MHLGKMLLSILVVALGVFLVVYGGYDDSPGAQLLGLVVALGGIVGIVKSRKKNPNHT